jgi:hypothetical protein
MIAEKPTVDFARAQLCLNRFDIRHVWGPHPGDRYFR